MLLGASVEGIEFNAAVDVFERLGEPPLLISRAGTEEIILREVRELYPIPVGQGDCGHQARARQNAQ
jgi:hypothetical protein